ncbi:type IV secretion protein Rhs [Caballeronia megalochromosomata]|nr:type IV secretion protein Rhs [Caballeronia megalochromosomata]
MNSLADRMLANKRFDFTSEAFGADKFAVVEMEGFESISQPFRFVLTLVSADASIDFDTMLSHRASFVIYGPEGGIRAPYHGILAEFEQLHRTDGYVFYRAVLVPRLWRLSLFRVSEVYLDERPITETVRGVLETGRLNSADYDFKLTGSYRPRTFVCQYQETYLDFVSRWLEKEGIYYYFDHSGGADKLVVIDDKIMHDGNALPVAYRPDDSLDTGLAADSVRDFVCRQKPLPHEVVLQDYNYRKAAVQLKARATVSDAGIGEVMLYGENFRDQQEGDRYAKLRAQELICGGKVYAGEGTALGLRSGYFCTLAQHYRDDFNGRYLVTEVHHEGSQAGALLNGVSSPYSDGARGGEIVYRNSFRAIPAATQFRPERTTAKPRVAGTMNATIDSEGNGQYAELDEYGQYKVQLPFDKTDKNANKSSARLRMASPYAGTDHGMHFPLHKDAEVLLSFIDGDPDQPVIVGSLANSENSNVVTQDNAHANRIATAGGNQFHMTDSKGKEAVWLHSPFHNSTIGIGSTDVNGGGSLWTSTAGSSEGVTVGVSNSLFAGTKNSLTLSYESSLSASMTTKASFGANVSFGLSTNVSWNKGKSITVDDSDTVSLKTSGKLQGAETVLISGGQDPIIKTTVDGVKDSIKEAVALSLAVNAVIGAEAGIAISAADDAGGGSGKVAPWTPGSYGVTAAQTALGGALTSILAHKVLFDGAKAIAAASEAKPLYASNIELGIAGIKATVLPLPGIGSTLQMSQFGSELSVASGPGVSSSVEVDSLQVVLKAGGANTTWVDSDGAGTRAATIKMTAVSNLTATAGADLGLKATGALSAQAAGNVSVKGSKVTIDALDKVATIATNVNVEAANAFSVTASQVKFNGSTVKFNSALIQLG